jgi:cytochrome c551/c552
MRTKLVAVGAIWILAVGLTTGAAPQNETIRLKADATTQAGATSAAEDGALLKQYCLTCHNERTKSGGLVLDADVAKVAADRERWEKVVRKVKTGMMPPSGMPRPARQRLDAFVAALETRLDANADVKASLDTPALHRLNRN